MACCAIAASQHDVLYIESFPTPHTVQGISETVFVCMQFEDPTDALQSLREHVDLQRVFASSTLSSLAKEVAP